MHFFYKPKEHSAKNQGFWGQKTEASGTLEHGGVSMLKKACYASKSLMVPLGIT